MSSDLSRRDVIGELFRRQDWHLIQGGFICPLCAALIHNKDKHREFHESLVFGIDEIVGPND